MQISALRPPSFHASQPLIRAVSPPAYASQTPSAYGIDRTDFKQPTYDPALPPRGSLWDRSDVRVGALMLGSATVGGGLGYFVAKSTGYSMGLSVAVGATLGMALPIALVYWGMSQWDGR